MYIWPILEEVVFTIKLASRQTKRRTCVTQQHGELVINLTEISNTHLNHKSLTMQCTDCAACILWGHEMHRFMFFRQFQMQHWKARLNESQDEDWEVLLLQLLLLPRQGDNLCQEWLQGLPLLQVGHKDFRMQLNAISGPNATKPSRGRRTPARPSGPRPSGNQLARSLLLIPALSLKRKGGTFKLLHFYAFEHSRKPSFKLLCPGMFRSSTIVSFGRTPSMLCRSLIIITIIIKNFSFWRFSE